MELYFKKLGAGPPLIIIHGLYGSSDNWISIARALTDKFTIYLVDQRNHGKSAHSDKHDYPSMRDDLLEFMDQQGLKKAILLGHSMGGKSAVFLSESNPERIQALIIIDIAPTAYSGEEHQSQVSTHKNILEGMMNVDFSLTKSREDIDEQLAQYIASPRIRSFLLKNVKSSMENGFEWKLNVQGLLKNLPNILDGLDPKKYRGGEEIAGFPVLFIRGQKSDYISDDDILRIKLIYPMARVTTLPDAGHWLHVEQPALLVRTIRYFL